MVASSNWVPVSWGGRGLVPPCGNYVADEVSISDETTQQHQQQQHQPTAVVHHQPVPPTTTTTTRELLYVDFDDSDEEMEPFDAERFVDRLVEDDPPPWRCDGSGEGSAHHLWAAPENEKSVMTGMPSGSSFSSRTTAAAAKLFLQPIYSWPPPPPLPGAPAHGTEGEGTRDMPIIVPHDPILDAIFTPARTTSPEIVPTVTLAGLVEGREEVPPALLDCSYLYNNHGNNDTNNSTILKKNLCAGINSGFEPAQTTTIYSIPPPPHAVTTDSTAAPAVRVPMAPSSRRLAAVAAGSGTGDRFRLASPSGAKVIVQSAAAAAGQRSVGGFPTHMESSKNIIDFASSSAATSAAAPFPPSPPLPPAATPLTGSDSFSEEYDDDRHAFLRQQEVALFVGPGYLAGPGRPGLVSPRERTAVVDWLSEVHAAAPGASGGDSPLSLETLFLAVNLLDRFLSTAEGARTAFAGWPALKLAGAGSLALASKYEDTQATSLWGVAVAAISGGGGDGAAGSDCFGENCCRGSGSGGTAASAGCTERGGRQISGEDIRAARKEVAAMELRVASALGFRLTVPTAMSFLGVFLRRAEALGYLAEGPAGSDRVREEAQQILLCVLRDASSLEHPPSALAASALYWASCVTSPGAVPPASFAFFAVTGYQLERLCRCLRDMENVRTGGGGRHGGLSVGGSGSGASGSGSGIGSGSGSGGDWAGAAFPEHAGRSLFGAGGGHPAISAL